MLGLYLNWIWAWSWWMQHWQAHMASSCQMMLRYQAVIRGQAAVWGSCSVCSGCSFEVRQCRLWCSPRSGRGPCVSLHLTWGLPGISEWLPRPESQLSCRAQLRLLRWSQHVPSCQARFWLWCCFARDLGFLLRTSAYAGWSCGASRGRQFLWQMTIQFWSNLSPVPNSLQLHSTSISEASHALTLGSFLSSWGWLSRRCAMRYGVGWCCTICMRCTWSNTHTVHSHSSSRVSLFRWLSRTWPAQIHLGWPRYLQVRPGSSVKSSS